MTLATARMGTEYTIRHVDTQDPELDSFLFSLGCYSGESITVINRRRRNLTVAIKDGRYSIDARLANTIAVH